MGTIADMESLRENINDSRNERQKFMQKWMFLLPNLTAIILKC